MVQPGKTGGRKVTVLKLFATWDCLQIAATNCSPKGRACGILNPYIYFFNTEKYKNSITVHKLVEIILFRTSEIQIRLFKFELNDSMLKAKK